jgi:serine/threonine protein kinase
MNYNKYKDKYHKYKDKYVLTKFIKNQIGGNFTYNISIDIYYDTLLDNIRSNIKKIPIIFSIGKYNSSKTLLNIKTYRNIEYLQSGAYAHAFKIQDISTNNFFVLKLGINKPQTTLNEARIIKNLFDNKDIRECCKYNIESFGINKIKKKFISQTEISDIEVSFMIIQYFGEINMEMFIRQLFSSVHDERDKIILIPSLLKQIILCLSDYNKHNYHNDIKLNNIIVNIDERNARIIDFGLSTPLDTVHQNYGYVQIPPEYIIKKFIPEYEVYPRDAKIDNFGLFWLIINCFTNQQLQKKYIITNYDWSNISFKPMLYFYLSINNIDKLSLLRIIDIKKDIFDDYKYDKDLKKIFLEDCYELTNKNIKEILFKNNKEKILLFFDILLRLIKFNISDRINIIEFIKFF